MALLVGSKNANDNTMDEDPAAIDDDLDEDETSAGAARQLRLCPLRGRDTPLYVYLWLLCGISCIFFAVGIWELEALTAIYCILASCLIAYFSVPRSIAWCVYSVACFAVTGFGIFVGLHFHASFASKTKLLLAIVIFLVVLLVALLVLSRVLPLLGLSIIGSSAAFAEREGWGWQPEVLKEMKFGWRCYDFWDIHILSHTWFDNARGYPARLVQDVIKNRAYWCGEVAVDYVFMLANDHDWIHVVFCFPGHGINRAQAFLMLLMLAALAVFIVSAFTTIIHSSILRMLVVLLMSTLPRVWLRGRLISIAFRDDNTDLTHAYRDRRWGRMKWRFIVKKNLIKSNRNLHMWQAQAEKKLKGARSETAYVDYGVCFLVVVIVVAACICVIVAMDYPLGKTIYENCDVLGYMFLLRLLAQILIFKGIPRGRLRPGGTYAGFFHHWYHQRASYGSLLPVAQKCGEMPASSV